MKLNIQYGFFLFVEKILRWSIHPKIRSCLLKLMGATVGRNVRIYEVQFINLKNGFKNLFIADDVHIGAGCLLDLEGKLYIGERTTISPRVVILTHQDPGSSHKSGLIKIYPPIVTSTKIGKDCWIGANSTIISGVQLSDYVVVGAGSMVNLSIKEYSLVAGAPAILKKKLKIDN